MFGWVLVMDDCNCKSSLISPNVVLNATMEQVYQRCFVCLRFPPFSNSPISIWNSVICNKLKTTNVSHMNVHFSVDCNLKKRQEIKGRKFSSSVFYLNNWELPTVILFLNKQEIDIWKSYVASASLSENQMRKQRQSGWFFLNLNIFECVSVTRCKRFSRHSKLSKTNI